MKSKTAGKVNPTFLRPYRETYKQGIKLYFETLGRKMPHVVMKPNRGLANLISILPEKMRQHALAWVMEDGLYNASRGRDKLAQEINQNFYGLENGIPSGVPQKDGKVVRGAEEETLDYFRTDDGVFSSDLFSHKAQKRPIGGNQLSLKDIAFKDTGETPEQRWFSQHEPRGFSVPTHGGHVWIDLDKANAILKRANLEQFNFGGQNGFLEYLEKGDYLSPEVRDRITGDANGQRGPDLSYAVRDQDNKGNTIYKYFGMPISTNTDWQGAVNNSTKDLDYNMQRISRLANSKAEASRIAKEIHENPNSILDYPEFADLEHDEIKELLSVMDMYGSMPEYEVKGDKERGEFTPAKIFTGREHTSGRGEAVGWNPIIPRSYKGTKAAIRQSLSEPPDGWFRSKAKDFLKVAKNPENEKVFKDYIEVNDSDVKDIDGMKKVAWRFRSPEAIEMVMDQMFNDEDMTMQEKTKISTLFGGIVGGGNLTLPKKDSLLHQSMPPILKDFLSTKAHQMPLVDFENEGIATVQDMEYIPARDANGNETEAIKKLRERGYVWDKTVKNRLIKGESKYDLKEDEKTGIWMIGNPIAPSTKNPGKPYQYPDTQKGKVAPRHTRALGRGDMPTGGSAGTQGFVKATPMTDMDRYNDLTDLLMKGGLGEREGAHPTEPKESRFEKDEREAGKVYDDRLGKDTYNLSSLKSVNDGIRQAIQRAPTRSISLPDIDKQFYVGKPFVSNLAGEGRMQSWGQEAIRNFSGDPAFRVGFTSPKEIKNILNKDMGKQLAQQFEDEIDTDEETLEKQTHLGGLLGRAIKGLPPKKLEKIISDIQANVDPNYSGDDIVNKIADDAAFVVSQAARNNKLERLPALFTNTGVKDNKVGAPFLGYQIPNPLLNAFYQNGYQARVRYVKLHVLGRILAAKKQDVIEGGGGETELSKLGGEEGEFTPEDADKLIALSKESRKLGRSLDPEELGFTTSGVQIEDDAEKKQLMADLKIDPAFAGKFNIDQLRKFAGTQKDPMTTSGAQIQKPAPQAVAEMSDNVRQMLTHMDVAPEPFYKAMLRKMEPLTIETAAKIYIKKNINTASKVSMQNPQSQADMARTQDYPKTQAESAFMNVFDIDDAFAKILRKKIGTYEMEEMLCEKLDIDPCMKKFFDTLPSWKPIRETEAIYDGSKNKDGQGYFWIGAAGGGGTTSIEGEADTAEEDPTGSKGTKKKHGRQRKAKSKK